MNTRFELTEQNYRYLFDNASDAMWVHNVEGYILVANKACEKLTGYTREELAGMNVIKFLTEEFLGTAREVKRKLLEGIPIPYFEQGLIKKDGTIGTVRMSTSPVIIDGKVIGFQSVARDITVEKKMQENMRYYVQQITRAQEDERKRNARVLHDDVAPPLLLLIQRLDAIASQAPSKPTKALKKSLEDLRTQAIEVLEELRRFAQDLRPRILDDLGLIAALEWMADDLAKNYGVDAHVETQGKEPAMPGDIQLLLFRIAQEALSNIRRHSGASKAVIRMDFDNGKIRMTVIDNGKGFILPAQGNELARSGKLGIAGMYERARLLGGDLRIESEIDKGTRVITEVPL